MKDIATQMQALDDFVTRARSQNAQHHESHVRSLGSLSGRVKSSYGEVGSRLTSSYKRVQGGGEEISAKIATLQESLEPLDATVNQPLAELRSIVLNTTLQEYQPTGETPQKVQYQYPVELPRTEAHETLLAALRRPVVNALPSKTTTTTTIPVIFNDAPEERDEDDQPMDQHEEVERRPAALGLREVDVNISSGSSHLSDDISAAAPVKGSVQEMHHPGKEPLGSIPGFKRSGSAGRTGLPRSARKASTVVALEGRENALFSQSTGRRRSPRLG